MQRFRGGMDHWDPAVTQGFADRRPVILFDNAGVASSSGETPDTIDAMAEHAADFVRALGLSEIDLLGFSIGGYIAQMLTIRHPGLIRRLVLVGTGPRAGEPPQDPKYVPSNVWPQTDPGQDRRKPRWRYSFYLFFRPSETKPVGQPYKVLGASRHESGSEDVDALTSAQTISSNASGDHREQASAPAARGSRNSRSPPNPYAGRKRP